MRLINKLNIIYISSPISVVSACPNRAAVIPLLHSASTALRPSMRSVRVAALNAGALLVLGATPDCLRSRRDS